MKIESFGASRTLLTVGLVLLSGVHPAHAEDRPALTPAPVEAKNDLSSMLRKFGRQFNALGKGSQQADAQANAPSDSLQQVRTLTESRTFSQQKLQPE